MMCPHEIDPDMMCPHELNPDLCNTESCITCCKDWLKQPWVENARAVGAEPVRSGEWVFSNYGYAHCSECGFEQERLGEITPYCPNCGAKMDGEG